MYSSVHVGEDSCYVRTIFAHQWRYSLKLGSLGLGASGSTAIC